MAYLVEMFPGVITQPQDTHEYIIDKLFNNKQAYDERNNTCTKLSDKDFDNLMLLRKLVHKYASLWIPGCMYLEEGIPNSTTYIDPLCILELCRGADTNYFHSKDAYYRQLESFFEYNPETGKEDKYKGSYDLLTAEYIEKLIGSAYRYTSTRASTISYALYYDPRGNRGINFYINHHHIGSGFDKYIDENINKMKESIINIMKYHLLDTITTSYMKDVLRLTNTKVSNFYYSYLYYQYTSEYDLPPYLNCDGPILEHMKIKEIDSFSTTYTVIRDKLQFSDYLTLLSISFGYDIVNDVVNECFNEYIDYTNKMFTIDIPFDKIKDHSNEFKTTIYDKSNFDLSKVKDTDKIVVLDGVNNINNIIVY